MDTGSEVWELRVATRKAAVDDMLERVEAQRDACSKSARNALSRGIHYKNARRDPAYTPEALQYLHDEYLRTQRVANINLMILADDYRRLGAAYAALGDAIQPAKASETD